MINEAKKYLNCDLAQKYKLMNYYNLHCATLVKPSRKYHIQYNDAWCAMFTSVMAHKMGLGRSQFPYEVSVTEQVKIAKSNGSFTVDVNKVKPNDLVIYDWGNNGTLDHVGLVVSVTRGVIKVIEGNIRNTVGYRMIEVDSSAIHGYILVGYNSVPVSEQDEVERINKLAKETIQGLHGNGTKRMDSLGVDYRAVQKYINTFYK